MEDMKDCRSGQMRAVLVVDDHPLYCDALAMALTRILGADDVRIASDLAGAVRTLGGKFRPDLIMLDLRLPDVTGVSGLARLREAAPDAPILVISADSSDELVHAAMAVGAAGFVAKDAPQQALQQALRAVQAGEKYLPPGYSPPEAAQRRSAEIRDLAQRIADLTPQQARIMRLICDGKPNKQIAWEMSLAEATVKAHVTALLRRLGVSNRTQAAILVREHALENALTREPGHG